MLSNTRLDGANVMGECLIAAEWVEDRKMHIFVIIDHLWPKENSMNNGMFPGHPNVYNIKGQSAF
jgi:hypothetical protein